LKFCEGIYGSLNEKKCSIGLFVDMTKAFDMVDLQILLNKLNMIGFRGTIHSWFTSYLMERRQRVKLNGVFSNELLVVSGVPQGSAQY